MEKEVLINLTPGCWRYHFRHSETLEPLSPLVVINISYDTEVKIAVPDDFIGKPNIKLYIERYR